MITSRQNSFIKEIKSLSEKKRRDEKGLFTVEGVKGVKEALASSFGVCAVVGTEKGFSFFTEGSVPSSVRVETVSEDVFSSITTESSPQGIIAVVKKPTVKPPKSENAIFLDRVSDPANVGAIVRTAVCAGITDIYLYGTADPFGEKAVRASMGGIFRVNFIEADGTASDCPLPLVVADMNGENVFERKTESNFCLVIGNEANGVSDEVKKRASFTVRIPMKNGMESLNAGVSAGILVYALDKNARKGE